MSTLALLFSFMQPWHDLHCKIEGRAAYDILTSFEQRWRKATKWSEMGRKLKRVSNWNDDSLIKIEHISWILSPSELTPVDDPKLWVSKEDDPENWHVQVFRSIDYGSLKGFPKDVVVAKTQLKRVEISQLARSKTLRHPHCPTLISILSETARWNPQNPLSKKSRRKAYTVVGTVGRRKPYTALGTVVGAQRSKLSTLPVNKLIVLYVVFKLDESYMLSKVSIHAGDGFHNLKEIKTVELMKPTGWVYLSLSGADPSQTSLSIGFERTIGGQEPIHQVQIPLGAILAIVDPVVIAVSNWMSTIILGTFRNNWEAYFNDPRPLEPERLKALRIQ
ncbi:Phospholipase D delta [Glycine soja]